MPTSHEFVANLANKIPLSIQEAAYLKEAGVHSVDKAYSVLLKDNPLNGDLSGWRRRAIVRALTPDPEVVLKAIPAALRPTGAGAPSEAFAEFKPNALLGLHALSAEHKLGTLPRRSLMSGAQYLAWPIEDQGARPTCVAFAVKACIELLRVGQGTSFRSLSAQFLYWHMRTNPSSNRPTGWNEGATKLGQAKEVLASDGICLAQSCPYSTAQPAPALGFAGNAPSAAAEQEAESLRIIDARYRDLRPGEQRDPGVAKEIYELLRTRGPVAIGIPIFPVPGGNTHRNGGTDYSGKFAEPPVGIKSDSGHALCVVGFEPDPEEKTGGWFIVRNSIGGIWGGHDTSEGPPTVPEFVGYGAISASYVEQYCWEYLSLKL